VRSRAAVPQGVGQDWKIEEITLDPPKAGEVLVRMHAAGICHSDDHFATGDGVPSDDMTAMMKAAGVVEEVGEGVTSLRPGDHVATSFLPAWRVQVVLVWNELLVRCRARTCSPRRW